MFLRAGAVSLVLLLASRLLGLVRESGQAAAFGATGLGDLAVLMLTFPDWIAGVLASGGLAYVLLPAWARQGAGQVAASQRRATHGLALAGCVLAALLAAAHPLALRWLLPGLSNELVPDAAKALLWSAAALPLAMVATVGAARLQHERDFVGLYGANLVVNLVVIAALAAVAWHLVPSSDAAVRALGAGLLLAMAARLAWLVWRRRRLPRAAPQSEGSALPRAPVWFWAVAAAGLPLALPFVARSLASQQGEGALATFNFAWKLVELPLLLAVQLVATLALGPIAQAFARASTREEAAATIRRGFALAWALACASAAGLLVASPALAELLFGWGRMQEAALAQVAEWARVGAWGLLPQSLTAIALAVLAAQGRMRAPVAAYGVALLLLVTQGPGEGSELMLWLNWMAVGVGATALWALRDGLRAWLPGRALAAPAAALLLLWMVLHWTGVPARLPVQLACGVASGLAVLALGWFASPDLRAALRR
ncbi:MAG TPA: lipid II flippase MurJ [Ramlibacter sp.]|jgi:peptidoglycan biosynthesis protein MviN/MurJ (putative lipid II flippase)